MGADWVLILISVVVPLLLCFINFVALAYFLDPDNTEGHFFSKLWIVRARPLAPLTAAARARPRPRRRTAHAVNVPAPVRSCSAC